MQEAGSSPVNAENPDGAGAFVILCDHASNRIPDDYQPFGLSPEVLQTHIAWDPGALAVARMLSAALDAPLFWPDVSRLVIDCNRPLDSATLIVAESDGQVVSVNRELSEAERTRRLARIHAPYHAAIRACLDRRLAAGRSTALVALHSFTPIFRGRARPWQIGLVFDEDRRLADRLVRGFEKDPSLAIGLNEPYSPADEVYYTVARHAGPRGLEGVMIELRSDEIASKTDQRRWADRIARILLAAAPRRAGAFHAAV